MDLKFVTGSSRNTVKYLTILSIMFFCLASSAQQTVAVDNPTGGFNINGSLTAGSTAGDWVQDAGGGFVLNNAGVGVNPATSFRVTDGYKAGPQDLILTQGSKFNNNPNGWAWSASDAGGKGDINNVLFHIATNVSTNQQWLFLAGDRKETNGTSYIDFEFLQNTLTRNTTNNQFTSAGPNGGRTENDIVISIGYSNGGSNVNVLLYLWKNIGTTANPNWSYVLQPNNLTGYSGFSNIGNINVPFGAFGSNTYVTNQFVEIAFNLTAFFQGINVCQ
ncbi:MAG: hypothetical protein ACJAQ1_000455, partial [Flavobacterium sp.]